MLALVLFVPVLVLDVEMLQVSALGRCWGKGEGARVGVALRET